jgi:hypothetical protein
VRSSSSIPLASSALVVQSETVLPFAGLHQLLRPVLDHASELPEPQGRSLPGAFGMVEFSDSNRFLIALGAQRSPHMSDRAELI